MEVKLHESDWRVNSIIVWIFVFKVAYPGEICLVEMRPEYSNAVFENVVRVIFVERSEKANYMLLLFCSES